ncbi:MAG: hypothetical protein KatS3mg125_2038 [Lysobacterales bacterium]|nr:MAG: hypothetical protein KatS3mg125_2038 [Xanthomonadales bacterium]
MPANSPHPSFAAIPERNTGDNLLRTAQQIQTQLSLMADTKANIIITVSSIVLTLSLARLNDPDLRAGAATLALFSLIALLLAILAVLPKYRPIRLRPGEPAPPQFNLLFFGHFANLELEDFLERMGRALRADGSVYEAQARDLYGQGRYLAQHKYPYLRIAYLFLLAGFLFACVVQAIVLLA